MKILALDSATEACSAALYLDGEILERYQVEPRGHARLLLPMVDQLCAEAEIKPASLDAVAFGRGPGSFTGLRIAAGITQGIAFGVDIPVLPISSLATIAQSAVADDVDGFMVAIDARMQEVYWGCFQANNGIVKPVMNETVCAPSAVSLPVDGHWLCLGTGWNTFNDELVQVAGRLISSIDGSRLPSSKDILPLAVADFNAGKAIPADQAAPVYLRDQVAHRPVTTKQEN